MEFLRIKWKYDSCLSVNCIGRAGGLALLWMSEINLVVQSFSQWHNDPIFLWRFTGFYGYPNTQLRSHSWKLLRMLHNQSDLPWFCARDFNEILLNDEKSGGARRPEWQMENFQSAVNDCGFQAIPFSGPAMRWSRRLGAETVFERLDRGLALIAWLNKFLATSETHLVACTSDHWPLLFNIEEMAHESLGGVPGNGEFENSWCLYDLCGKIIKNTWDSYQPSNLREMQWCMDACLNKLKLRNNKTLESLDKRVKKKAIEIEKMLTDPSSSSRHDNLIKC